VSIIGTAVTPARRKYAGHTLAAMLPDAWVQTSVGTTYTLSAA